MKLGMTETKSYMTIKPNANELLHELLFSALLLSIGQGKSHLNVIGVGSGAGENTGVVYRASGCAVCPKP